MIAKLDLNLNVVDSNRPVIFLTVFIHVIMSQILFPTTCLFAQVTPITQHGVLIRSNLLEGQLMGNPALLVDRRVVHCSLGRSAILTIKWEASDYELVISFNSSLQKAVVQLEKKFKEEVAKLHPRLRGVF